MHWLSAEGRNQPCESDQVTETCTPLMHEVVALASTLLLASTVPLSSGFRARLRIPPQSASLGRSPALLLLNCYLSTHSIWRIMIATHLEGMQSSVSTAFRLEQPDTWSFNAPHAQSSGIALSHDRRALVYHVALDFRPLWTLESVEEFEQCYVDLLESKYT